MVISWYASGCSRSPTTFNVVINDSVTLGTEANAVTPGTGADAVTLGLAAAASVFLLGLGAFAVWAHRRLRRRRQCRNVDGLGPQHTPSTDASNTDDPLQPPGPGPTPDELVQGVAWSAIVPLEQPFPGRAVAGELHRDRFFTHELLDPASGAYAYPCDFTGYKPQYETIEDVLTALPAAVITCTSTIERFRGRTITQLFEEIRSCRNLTMPEEDLKHVQAVHAYSVQCPLYARLNRSMREGNDAILTSQIFRPYCDYIRLLRMALARAKQANSGLVPCLYRGIGVVVSADKYKAGQTITWQAFSSATVDLKKACEFLDGTPNKPTGTLFCIVNVTNARGISDWSQYPEEQEWLYPPNTHFKVTPYTHFTMDQCNVTMNTINSFWDNTSTDASGVRVIILREF